MCIKQAIKIVLTIYLLFILNGCKRQSNPNLDQGELEAQVLSDSLIKLQSYDDFEFKIDSSKTHFRQKSIRSHLPNKPPKIIDISTDPSIIREVKLSELGSKIQYLKLTAPDSLYFTSTPSTFQFYGNHIISHNLVGTAVFDIGGNHIEDIAKNDIQIFSSGRGSYGFYTGEFRGIFKPPVIYKNNLYFIYSDYSREEKRRNVALSKYDLDKLDYKLTNNQQELSNITKGEPIIPVNGVYSDLQIIDDDTWIGHSSFMSGELFHSLTLQGDTLSTFKDFDAVQNYHGGPYRSPERMLNYRLGEKLMFKQAFSDTLFHIVSSTQMIPEYVFNRGGKGVNTRTGINPKVDLFGKIIIHELLETDKWFIIVLKNNHSSPNNKKAGIVQFTYWFYNKQIGEIIKRPGEFDNDSQGLKNDVDNGPDIWPMQVTPEGWILNGQAVKWLKEDYTLEQLKELYPFETFNDNEYILTILK